MGLPITLQNVTLISVLYRDRGRELWQEQGSMGESSSTTEGVLICFVSVAFLVGILLMCNKDLWN